MTITFTGPSGNRFEFITDLTGGMEILQHGWRYHSRRQGSVRDVEEDSSITRLSEKEVRKLATFLEVFIASQEAEAKKSRPGGNPRRLVK